MDLALGGPYYSEFLLVSIFALAARHANKNDERFKYLGKGVQFLAKAKELLLREMTEGKPKIPTIQGLLILGGRQILWGVAPKAGSTPGWLSE